jgi:hypothetical protein
MSQNFLNEHQFISISSRLSSLEDQLKNVVNTMSKHFETLNQSINQLIEGNNKLLELQSASEVTISAQDTNEQDTVEEMFLVKVIEEHPVSTNASFTEAMETLDSILEDPPSPDIPIASSSIKLRKVEHVKCDMCNKLFPRGSLTDSITKHARETDCLPYKCRYCDKFFREVS